MMPISTKLTLLVLALPISVLLLLDLVIFYYYKTSIEVSALLSTILVVLLVWERFRDSLSKKLEYLHKSLLFKLFKAFQSDIFYLWQDEVKSLKPNLERYGKFMGISLYPRNLSKQIDQFLIYHIEFYGSLQKLNEVVEKYGLSLERSLLYHFTGIKPLGGLGSFNPALVNAYQKRMPTVLKEQSQLIEEIKELLQKTEKMRKQVVKKLEDFLKSNNLRLEEEPFYRPYHW